MPLLGKQSPKHLGRATLVLDLDHTLVHGEVLRPGLDEFLDEMAKVYEVVLFTAAEQQLVAEAVRKIDKGRFAFRLFGDSCMASKPGVKYKLLKELGRELKRVVVVDDTPTTYKYNEENALPISAFYMGSEDTDEELYELVPFLRDIAHLDDLREPLCKRKGYANCKVTKVTEAAVPVNKKR